MPMVGGSPFFELLNPAQRSDFQTGIWKMESIQQFVAMLLLVLMVELFLNSILLYGIKLLFLMMILFPYFQVTEQGP